VPVPVPRIVESGPFVQNLEIEWYQHGRGAYRKFSNPQYLAPLIRSINIDISESEGEQESIHFETETDGIPTTVELHRDWTVDGNLENITITYGMGSSAYFFTWTTHPFCRNDEIDEGETCDTSQLDGLSCEDFDYGPGTLVCNLACDVELSGCSPSLSGTWEEVGSMGTDRSLFFSAVPLLNGDVLITGGTSDLATAEIYDSGSKQFTPTGSMAGARMQHTSTVLEDGRVLIVGGRDVANTELATAEIYAPETGQFTATGSMAFARKEHTATLLGDGRVLVIGGDDSLEKTSEIYDPGDGQFSTGPSLAVGRHSHSATLMPSGDVFVFGGLPSSGAIPVDEVEIYIAGSNQFGAAELGDSVSWGRHSHDAIYLPGTNEIVIAGGKGIYQSPAYLIRRYDLGKQEFVTGPKPKTGNAFIAPLGSAHALLTGYYEAEYLYGIAATLEPAPFRYGSILEAIPLADGSVLTLSASGSSSWVFTLD